MMIKPLSSLRENYTNNMFNGTIPKLRKDLDIRPIKHENQDLILLHDRKSIAKHPVVVTPEMFSVLYFLEENLTESTFREVFRQEFKIDNVDNLLEQIKELDELGFLESNRLRELLKQDENRYLSEIVRPMITADSSYPQDKDEFLDFMEKLFQKNVSNSHKTNSNGVIAPHLDLSLEDYSHRVYAAAYNSIKDTEADTYIIFGTSHFAFSAYYMFTEKPYSTPLGNLEIDSKLLKTIFERSAIAFGDNYLNLIKIRQIDEQAHRWEHSIEYAAVMLSYINRGRNIKILPILVGSFYEFLVTKKQPLEDKLINNFLEIVRDVAAETDKKICWISSVDFSHIGLKFGDDFDALDKLEECGYEDKISIASITGLKPTEFFEKAIFDQDKWRICGLSPIYSQMIAMQPNSAKLLDYNQWYEKDTKSAVTIAAISLD